MQDHTVVADETTPMQIAHHELFTAKEKLELLQELKTSATGVTAAGDPQILDPDEIEAAIEEVKVGAQEGVDPFIMQEEQY